MLRLGEPELALGGEKSSMLPLALGVLDLGGECQLVVLGLTSFGFDALLLLGLGVEYKMPDEKPVPRYDNPSYVASLMTLASESPPKTLM